MTPRIFSHLSDSRLSRRQEGVGARPSGGTCVACVWAPSLSLSYVSLAAALVPVVLRLSGRIAVPASVVRPVVGRTTTAARVPVMVGEHASSPRGGQGADDGSSSAPVRCSTVRVGLLETPSSPLLTVTAAGTEDVNGEYACVRVDLGRLGAIQRNAVYQKVDDESVMLVLFRYRPSICCFFDPGCAVQQASFIGPKRARWAIVRCTRVSRENRRCWKCSWRDCMGGFAPQAWSIDEILYVSDQQPPRVSLQTNGVLAVKQWQDARLALLNGSGHCTGKSPPPLLHVGNDSAKRQYGDGVRP